MNMNQTFSDKRPRRRQINSFKRAVNCYCGKKVRKSSFQKFTKICKSPSQKFIKEIN